MELDVLKAAWQNIQATPKGNAEIKKMMQESAHPVLKRIRKQLIIEIVAFTVFLFVYYDFFDGDRKPLYTNVLLVAALLFIILHSMIGYRLTKHRDYGSNMSESLESHYLKMKWYAVVSVVSRAWMAGCLLIFFASVVTFTGNKYWILVGLIIVFLAQMVLLSKIWIKRIRQMKETIYGLYS